MSTILPPRYAVVASVLLSFVGCASPPCPQTRDEFTGFPGGPSSLDTVLEPRVVVEEKRQNIAVGLSQVAADYRSFYDRDTLGLFGWGLVFASIAANSTPDRKLHENFQSSVRGATSDDWFELLHANKDLGDFRYTLPVCGLAWGAALLVPDSELLESLGGWGQGSLRAYLVGGPAVGVLQTATGASRPGESPNNSDWQPFQDANGVSGHAFVSAVPFITAAKQTEDRRLQSLFYAASTLGSLSRVNDGAHYPSQAALGWGIAYLAVSAVNDSDTSCNEWDVQYSCRERGPSISLTQKF